MAFGTFTKGHSDFDHPFGGPTLGRYIVSGAVALSSSYTTGGEAVTASTFDSNATAIVNIICTPSTDGANVHSFDVANSKIIATVSSTGAELAATTDISAAAKQFQVIAVLT
jgi:hypothetical protein